VAGVYAASRRQELLGINRPALRNRAFALFEALWLRYVRASLLVILRAGAAAHTQREEWIGGCKMILVLDDAAVDDMLRLKASGARAEEVLRNRISRFRGFESGSLPLADYTFDGSSCSGTRGYLRRLIVMSRLREADAEMLTMGSANFRSSSCRSGRPQSQASGWSREFHVA